MDKTEIHHAAEQYVTNHKDGEVRRMYGHHYRSFTDGAKFIYDKLESQNAEYIEALREAKEQNEELKNAFMDIWECFGGVGVPNVDYIEEAVNKMVEKYMP